MLNVIEHLHRWSRGMTLAFQANSSGSNPDRCIIFSLVFCRKLILYLSDICDSVITFVQIVFNNMVRIFWRNWKVWVLRLDILLI
jgi:hypothetical protein